MVTNYNEKLKSKGYKMESFGDVTNQRPRG